jgi:nucleotide-binding universal stress UspA family protein
MHPTNRGPVVVVGVDGSAPSILALRWAGALARILDARIRAVTAWQFQIALGTFTPVVWNPEARAQNICSQAAASAFGDTPPAGLGLITVQGAPAKILVEESRRARLIIVGSRGYGGFDGLLLGSVSVTVAEHSKCPVLIAHGTDLPPKLPTP